MTKDYSLQIPKLSPRLSMVASMVQRCDRVIDIGTDHAFVPIYLVATHCCERAIASDIRVGPAAIARRNIEQYQMEDLITVVIGDGIGDIQVNSTDCVIIAGMGGFEILSILSTKPVKASSIIVQPQKSLKELRLFLSQKGYAICKESIAKEQNRFYIAMSIVYTGTPYILKQTELEIGPCILQDEPPHFHEYLNHRMDKMRKERLGNPDIGKVLEELEQLNV